MGNNLDSIFQKEENTDKYISQMEFKNLRLNILQKENISYVKELQQKIEVYYCYDLTLTREQLMQLMRINKDKVSEVFKYFDYEGNNKIFSYDLLIAMALTSYSQFNDKVEFIFDLYDFDKSQNICKDEMEQMIYSTLVVICVLNNIQRPKFEQTQQIAQYISQTYDSDMDKSISKGEFLNIMSKNKEFLKLISYFGYISKQDFRKDFGQQRDTEEYFIPHIDSDFEDEENYVKQQSENNDQYRYQISQQKQSISNSLIMETEYIYGFNTSLRNNIRYTEIDKIMFTADNYVIIEDIHNFKQKIFNKHEQEVVCFSLMNNQCLSCSIDGIYILWDIDTLEMINQDRMDKIVKASFNTDQRNFVIINIQQTKLQANIIQNYNMKLENSKQNINLQDGMMIDDLKTYGVILDDTYDPDDLVFDCYFHGSKIYVSTKNNFYVLTVKFDNDKFSCSKDYLHLNQNVTAISHIKDNVLLGCINGQVFLVSNKTGDILQNIKSYSKSTINVIRTKKNTIAYLGTKDGTIIILDQNAKKIKDIKIQNQSNFQLINKKIKGIDENIDGDIILLLSGGQIIEIKEQFNYQCLKQYHHHLNINDFVMKNDNNESKLITVSDDSKIYIYNLKSKNLIKKLSYNNMITQICSSDEHQEIAIGFSNGIVNILSAKFYEIIKTIVVDRKRPIEMLRFSQQNRRLLVYNGKCILIYGRVEKYVQLDIVKNISSLICMMTSKDDNFLVLKYFIQDSNKICYKFRDIHNRQKVSQKEVADYRSLQESYEKMQILDKFYSQNDKILITGAYNYVDVYQLVQIHGDIQYVRLNRFQFNKNSNINNVSISHQYVHILFGNSRIMLQQQFALLSDLNKKLSQQAQNHKKMMKKYEAQIQQQQVGQQSKKVSECVEYGQLVDEIYMKKIAALYEDNKSERYYDINNEKVVLDNQFLQINRLILVQCCILHTTDNLIIVEAFDGINQKLRFFNKHKNKVTHVTNNQSMILSNEYDSEKKANTILMWDLLSLQVLNCEVIKGNIIRQVFQFGSYIYVHQDNSLFLYDYMVNKYNGSIEIFDEIYDLRVLKNIMIMMFFDRILICKQFDRNIVICDVIYKKPAVIEDQFKGKQMILVEKGQKDNDFLVYIESQQVIVINLQIYKDSQFYRKVKTMHPSVKMQNKDLKAILQCSCDSFYLLDYEYTLQQYYMEKDKVKSSRQRVCLDLQNNRLDQIEIFDRTNIIIQNYGSIQMINTLLQEGNVQILKYLVYDKIVDVVSDGANILYMIITNKVHICEVNMMVIQEGIKVNNEEQLKQVSIANDNVFVSGTDTIYQLDPKNNLAILSSHTFNHTILKFLLCDNQIIVCTVKNLEHRRIEQNFKFIHSKEHNFKGKFSSLDVQDNKVIIKGQYKNQYYQTQVNIQNINAFETENEHLVNWFNYRFQEYYGVKVANQICLNKNSQLYLLVDSNHDLWLVYANQQKIAKKLIQKIEGVRQMIYNEKSYQIFIITDYSVQIFIYLHKNVKNLELMEKNRLSRLNRKVEDEQIDTYIKYDTNYFIQEYGISIKEPSGFIKQERKQLEKPNINIELNQVIGYSNSCYLHSSNNIVFCSNNQILVQDIESGKQEYIQYHQNQIKDMDWNDNILVSIDSQELKMFLNNVVNQVVKIEELDINRSQNCSFEQVEIISHEILALSVINYKDNINHIVFYNMKIERVTRIYNYDYLVVQLFSQNGTLGVILDNYCQLIDIEIDEVKQMDLKNYYKLICGTICRNSREQLLVLATKTGKLLVVKNDILFEEIDITESNILQIDTVQSYHQYVMIGYSNFIKIMNMNNLNVINQIRIREHNLQRITGIDYDSDMNQLIISSNKDIILCLSFQDQFPNISRFKCKVVQSCEPIKNVILENDEIYIVFQNSLEIHKQKDGVFQLKQSVQLNNQFKLEAVELVQKYHNYTELVMVFRNGTINYSQLQSDKLDVTGQFNIKDMPVLDDSYRIQCKLSEDRSKLAVVAQSQLYILGLNRGKFESEDHNFIVAKNEPIQSIEWSVNSQFLMLSTKKEISFYDVNIQQLLPKGLNILKDEKWMTYNSTLGWSVSGLKQLYSPKIVSRSSISLQKDQNCKNMKNVVISDCQQKGQFKIHQYPCIDTSSECYSLNANINVNQVLFNYDNSYLITASDININIYRIEWLL